MTAVINPIDLITTRLWNQPVVAGRGTLYASGVDCLVKTGGVGLRGVEVGEGGCPTQCEVGGGN